MTSMKIIHMSDLHIADKGKPIWDTDTLAHFDAAVERIRTEVNIDAIFITGDIADNGSKWAYDYVDNRLAQLGIPTYLCPGNHDWLPNMKKAFNYCKIVPFLEMGGWEFVFMDSTIKDPDDANKNKARGGLKEGDFKFITEIAMDSDLPICLLLHHSPIEPGGWMNRKLLENRKEFKSIIEQYNMIKLVLFGHIHYPLIESTNNIIYSSAPSIGFAFDKDLPKYQILNGAEGYNVISIKDNHIEIRHERLSTIIETK